MTTNRFGIFAFIAVISLSTALAEPAGEFVTPAQVAAAKSTADHESLAHSYDAEAAAYDKRVDWHESLRQSYAVSSAKGPQQQMARHCQQLMAKFQSIAQEYREMAATERKMKSANSK